MNPSHYAGFPRYTGPEQGSTVYPPKDTSWMADASCVGMDADLFFSESGASTPAGRAVCARCVVRQECLDYAMTPPLERWGLWGGLSVRERGKLRAKRDREKAPHGTRRRYTNGCRCEQCRAANAEYGRRRRTA